MKTMHTYTKALLIFAALGVIAAAAPASADRVYVSGGTDIQVWVNDGWDVYPSYNDVVISVRSARDCYATVFVVDTDGYVHVVYPYSPWENAWIRGGRTYCYSGYDLGLADLGGRGIAHVFAIGSPYPFDYSPYGEAIFVGRFGYRVYGDPFIASRQIYLSMLPASIRIDFVSVSMTRFYIREWARYPHYLCRGHHNVHVRFGDYCNQCARVYDGYRIHVADPYPVIHPRAKFKRSETEYAEVRRSTRKFKASPQRTVARTQSRSFVREGATGRTRTTVNTKSRVVSTKSTAKRREAVAGWNKTSSSRSKLSTTTPRRTTTRSTNRVVTKSSSVKSSTARKAAPRSSGKTTKKVTNKRGAKQTK